MSDQDQLIQAVTEMQALITEWTKPGPRDAFTTINRMMVILFSKDFLALTDRLKQEATHRNLRKYSDNPPTVRLASKLD